MQRPADRQQRHAPDAVRVRRQRHREHGRRRRDHRPQQRGLRDRHAEVVRAQDHERVRGLPEREDRDGDEQAPEPRRQSAPGPVRLDRARRRRHRAAPSPTAASATHSAPGSAAHSRMSRNGMFSASRPAASSGPMTAPALSNARCRPNATPRRAAGTERASSASRGDERRPLPSRSSTRSASTIGHDGREREQRPRHRREAVAGDHEQLRAPHAVVPDARDELQQRRRRLGRALDEPERARTGAEHRREVQRQQRIDQFRRGVVQQADEPEDPHGRRQRAQRFAHQSAPKTSDHRRRTAAACASTSAGSTRARSAPFRRRRCCSARKAR